MLSAIHDDLKTQVLNKCLAIFPEAKSVILWGGSITPGFAPAVNDVDVIIEVDADFKQETVLAERLKTLVQTTSFCRLDPFIYLTEGEAEAEDALEFIAPFGFYKANPFIPYLLQIQHEVLYGKSRLLPKVPQTSMSEALLGFLPQVMGALKRLRMDAAVEQSWAPLIAKHKSYFFVIARTYFAFEQGGVGTKKESLAFLAKKFPQYKTIVDQLSASLTSPYQAALNDEPSAETVIDFVRDMEVALQAAKHRATAH